MKRQRRKVKKPLSDTDSDSEFDEKSKSSSSSSKDKDKNLKSPFSFDSNFDIDVKDGINDLAMLPRELIESELIARGFHPDMTHSLETKFLANTLRSGKCIPKIDEDQNGRPYFSTYSYQMSKNQAPIFNNTPDEILKKRKIEKMQRMEKEEEEEMMEMDQSLDPEEFKKDSSNEPKTANVGIKNNAFNQPFYTARRPVNVFLCMNLLDYGFDIDNLLDNSPKNDALLKKMSNNIPNSKNYEDIIFQQLILNSDEET